MKCDCFSLDRFLSHSKWKYFQLCTTDRTKYAAIFCELCVNNIILCAFVCYSKVLCGENEGA